MSSPTKVLKDYYFPVRVANLQKNAYVTLLEPFTNGIPHDATVVRVSAPPPADFCVICCLHAGCGWVQVSVAKGQPNPPKKLRRTKAVEEPSDVTFSMMLRITSLQGAAYSGMKRPTFPLKFERYEMVDGVATLKSEYSVVVEAATKIPKNTLVVHLPDGSPNDGASSVEASSEASAEGNGRSNLAPFPPRDPIPMPQETPQQETQEEPNTPPKQAVIDDRLQPMPGTFTQDWGVDIFSESHNDDLVSPFDTPAVLEEDNITSAFLNLPNSLKRVAEPL